MITPEQAQKIKAGLEAGNKTLIEIGEEAGVHKSTIERVNRLFIKKGKFGEFLEKAEHMASLSGKSNGASRPKKHADKHPSLKMIANMKHLRAQGMTLREIAERLGVSSNTVWYQTGRRGAKKANGRPAAREGKQAKLTAKIHALRGEGVTLRDIAKKLHVPDGTVSYRLYGKPRGKQTKESTNGASSSATATTFSRDIRIGIAFAEVERFIGVLSERLGESPKVLRPRLSELLGHSPLRESPGDGD